MYQLVWFTIYLGSAFGGLPLFAQVAAGLSTRLFGHRGAGEPGSPPKIIKVDSTLPWNPGCNTSAIPNV
jgi:hypothetical protein